MINQGQSDHVTLLPAKGTLKPRMTIECCNKAGGHAVRLSSRHVRPRPGMSKRLQMTGRFTPSSIKDGKIAGNMSKAFQTLITRHAHRSSHLHHHALCHACLHTPVRTINSQSNCHWTRTRVMLAYTCIYDTATAMGSSVHQGSD